MKLHSLISAVILYSTLHAANITYKPVPLPGGNFESNISAWPLNSEYKIGTWGYNGSKGLKCERHGKSYNVMMRRLNLKPGSSYRLSWKQKINGTLSGEGAAVSVDWYAKGSWVSFTMLKMIKNTNNEWKQFSGEFTAPNDPELTIMLLAYLRRNTTGTVYFDDFRLEEIIGETAVYPLNASTGRITQDTPLEIAAYVSGNNHFAEMEYHLINMKTQKSTHGVLQVRNGRAILDLKNVIPGKYTLNLTPVTRNGNQEKTSFKYPLTVERKSSARVRIDNLGRTLIDGKTFMPVGWFAGSLSRGRSPIWSDYNLSLIAKSPFNTVMPYNGLSLRESKLTDAGEKACEALDACQEAGQMVIFSAKHLYPDNKKWNGRTNKEWMEYWLKNLKNHPALLAWYISDELSKDKIPQLIRRRRMINELDPNHPTWAVFCSYADLPYFGSTFDVVGIDPYPINTKKDRGMKSVLNALQDTHRSYRRNNGELALWAVPQAHNTKVYNLRGGENAEEFLKNTRPPTEREMLSMSLLEAICGAKGFIFYSEFDLRNGPEAKRYKERWEIACRVAQTLRDLEPFIMASVPRLPIKIQVLHNQVKARAMVSDNGETALLIASALPGKADAIISGAKLPSGLKSMTGNTKEISPGCYRFQGKDADCDILR